ncbi:MAG: oxygen-independent coproporphyrinogen III oxidase [bacterium]|nr:oxygen-independent coproporphyrinogen III oxidase [bacterium]
MPAEQTYTQVPIELLRKYDRPGPRYTSYPTVPVWSNEIGAEQYVAALQATGAKTDLPLALYCHIPFCRKRCFYCGCNTVITNNPDRVNKYVADLALEIINTSEHLGERRNVSQLHLGGGTPTFVGCRGLEIVLKVIDDRFKFIAGAEKSIEVDPRVTTDEQLEFLASVGFNRISIGTQDFDPAVQEAIGRIQSYERVQHIIEKVRTMNFRGINIDLIYGLPLQSVESFKTTLAKSISLRPDRVALYSFAYLPQNMANQMAIKSADLPTTEVKYQLFATAVEEFTKAGYRQIGMDHFALPDDELALAQKDGRLHRNFMGYTVQTAPEMIGFGMSAIGYVNDSFFQNYSKLDSYETAIREKRFAIYRGMNLTQDDLIRQYVISQLMCNFRLHYQAIEKLFAVKYDEYFRNEHEGLNIFLEDNLMTSDETGLQITPVGRTFVRNIAMTFDAYLDSNGESKGVRFSRTI